MLLHDLAMCTLFPQLKHVMLLFGLNDLYSLASPRLKLELPYGLPPLATYLPLKV